MLGDATRVVLGTTGDVRGVALNHDGEPHGGAVLARTAANAGGGLGLLGFCPGAGSGSPSGVWSRRFNEKTPVMLGSGPVTISVVVVNWNAREDLAACLASLAAQTDRDFETIVVDNGSVDDSVSSLAGRYADVVWVEAGENLGFAEGCNRGIAAAGGSWIATLNNDAIADARFIEELRSAALSGGPSLGMVQSRIVFQRDTQRTNSTGLLLYADGCAEDRDFDQPIRADDRNEEIFCPTAGAALYRRAMLDEVRLPSGFFDRGYFMYVEDLDLGWRSRLAGWSTLYAPRALVAHKFQGTSRRHGRRFVELQCKKNRLRTLVKNGSLRMLVTSLPRTLVDLAESCLWIGPSAIARFATAAWDSARQRPAISKMRRIPRREIERRWITVRT